MDEKPLVSVLIAAYNEEDWIEKALESIVSQTYKNIEIIVVDDGSTDDTLKILETKRQEDRRINIITQENKGLTRSLNIGISKCNGKYIARMDADNISRKDRIQKQVTFLTKNADYTVVGSWRKEIDEKGNIKKRKFPVKNEEIKKWLIRACVISHSAAMIQAHKLRHYMYDESFKTSQDYDLWVRMAKKEKFYNIPEFLTTAYNRKTGITNSKKRKEAFKTKMRIKRKALNNIKHPLHRKLWLLKPFYELIR